MQAALHEIRKHANGGHAQKVKLNFVLEAITEVIHERQEAKAEPSATEYFASLMTALESSDKTHDAELFALLQVVIPGVPDAVLRTKFKPVAAAFTKFSEAHAQGEDSTVLRPLIHCVSCVLIAQEASAATWSRPVVLKFFHVILGFMADRRPKVRKIAYKGILDILQAHKASNFDGLASHVSSFVIKVLSACKKENCTQALQLLAFLEEAVPAMPPSTLGSLYEPILRLLSLGHPLPSSLSLRVLGLFFHDTGSTAAVKPTQLKDAPYTVPLISGLLDLQPGTAEVTTATEFAKALGRGLKQLHFMQGKGGARQVQQLLPRGVLALCTYFEAPHVRTKEVDCAGLCSLQ